MSADRCCEIASSGSHRETVGERATDSDPHPPTLARRCLDIAGSLVPGAILERPAYLAAFVAIGSGVGLSLSPVTYLRMPLVILLVASLSYLLVRGLRHFIAALSKGILENLEPWTAELISQVGLIAAGIGVGVLCDLSWYLLRSR